MCFTRQLWVAGRSFILKHDQEISIYFESDSPEIDGLICKMNLLIIWPNIYALPWSVMENWEKENQGG